MHLEFFLIKNWKPYSGPSSNKIRKVNVKEKNLAVAPLDIPTCPKCMVIEAAPKSVKQPLSLKIVL